MPMLVNIAVFKKDEILAVVFNRFYRILKGASCRKSPIATGRNDRLKSNEFLNLIEHIS